MTRTLRRLIPLLALALFVTTGCRSGRKEDPLLRLAADEALETGKALMADKKWSKARRYLTHAFEVEPNSRGGREALLLAADTLYLQGGLDNFLKCKAKYTDFLNRFPTSDRADYAQFQIGNCLAGMTPKPDRDQSVTLQALEAYRELLRLYPTSSYVDEAEVQIQVVTDHLAKHELLIGEFYSRYGICTAAANRLEYLREQYPAFSEMDRVLFGLGVAYQKCRRTTEALDAWGDLLSQYPDSPYVAKLAKARGKEDIASPATPPAATADPDETATEGEENPAVETRDAKSDGDSDSDTGDRETGDGAQRPEPRT